MEPRNLTHIAALPDDLYTAPTSLTCITLKISVVMLARKALANKAKMVKAARDVIPRKGETTAIAEPNRMIEANGMPRRWAMMDARVCSSQVMGSQYGG